MRKLPNRIQVVIDDIADQYQERDRYNRPWIIGFSGGKDSTVLLTLTWIALQQLLSERVELRRKVYVVCNDTMVENPVIEEYVQTVLKKIDDAAKEQKLPILVYKTLPELEDSFWCLVIGKGYPVPNNAFRFCTEKMKIKPTSKFIENKVSSNGEAIVLIGTRRDESAQRAKSIEKHEIKGHRLSKHPLNPNTYTYAPIKDLMLEDIWWIIQVVPSPWGFDNNILFNIYKDASADDYECPTMMTSTKQPSCGQSRFGCWVCTVVVEDKSMTSLIKNGVIWMQPLLDFRNKLVEDRNKSEYRRDTRRNGQRAVDETGHNQGNYTIEYRQKILRELLQVQKRTQQHRGCIELITQQELMAIQILWYRDGCFSPTVNDIYSYVYGYNIPNEQMPLDERILLEKNCVEHGHYQLIQELLALQKSKNLLMRKYGLQNDIEHRLDEFLKEKK
ncbi:MAG: DNA phosphorothioation system sulfurtransferase DndC [Prevotella sp.]|jgi:DNA sulfur modification protein DndC|nr:DNA phosphorothioation system sulfurtransferase DndC [Prevotella sp.]